MFIRVILSAKIGKDYKCETLGVIVQEDGIMHITFPKDVDLTKPFTMICEPSDGYVINKEKKKPVNPYIFIGDRTAEYIVDPSESS